MAEQANINVGVNIGEGAKSLRTLKQEFKDIQKELDSVQVGTDEYKKKLQQLADVKDEIDDLNDAIKSSTGAGKFEAFAKVGSAIAGGFAAAQGAMALFGSESEELQKSLMKVQGAMALAQGVAQLEDLGNAFKNAKNVVMDFGKSAMTAIKGMNKALLASGIGALVVALGAVVAYWDDIKEAISGVDAEQKKLLENQKQSTEASQKQLDSISKQENILKLQGKSEKEILQMKVSATKQVITGLEAQLQSQKAMKQQQVETAKRNKDILEGILKFLTAPITMLLKTVDYVGKALGKDFGLEEKFYGGIAGLIFDPEEVATEADKTIAETEAKLTELKNSQAGYELSIQNINKDAAQKQADANKARLESEAELQKRLQELRTANINDAEVQELQRLKNQFEADQKAIRDSKGSEETKAAALLELKQKYENDWKGIEDKFEAERVKKKEEADKKAADEAKKAEEDRIKNALLVAETEQLALKNQRDLNLQDEIDYENKKYAILISNKQLTNEELKKLEEEHAAKLNEIGVKQLAQEKAIQDAKFNLLKDSLNLASELVSTFAGQDEASQRKAFELNKKIKLSLAVMDGIKGVQNAYISALDSPFTKVFPAYPFIQAGIAGAFSAASIAKIAQTQYQSSGGGANIGAPSGGSAGGGVPSIGSVGNTSTNIENLQNQNTQKQEPIKAVVVQTEMASVNQQVNRIEERSKIN